MRPVWLVTLGLMAVAGRLAGEQVTVLVPSSVSFYVSDVSAPTSAGSVNVSFSGASLGAGKALRIGVRASGASLSTPAGAAIGTSSITWTTTGASGGSGSGGTLNAGSFSTVFQSVGNPTSGSVSLSFRLAPPGAGVKAVEQSLALEWLFESVAQ